MVIYLLRYLFGLGAGEGVWVGMLGYNKKEITQEIHYFYLALAAVFFTHSSLYPTIKRSPQVSEPLIRLLHTGEVYIVTQMKPTRLAQTVWIENGLIISSVSLNATPQPLAW